MGIENGGLSNRYMTTTKLNRWTHNTNLNVTTNRLVRNKWIDVLSAPTLIVSWQIRKWKYYVHHTTFKNNWDSIHPYSLLLNNALFLSVSFKPIFVDFAPIIDNLVLLTIHSHRCVYFVYVCGLCLYSALVQKIVIIIIVSQFSLCGDQYFTQWNKRINSPQVLIIFPVIDLQNEKKPYHALNECVGRNSCYLCIYYSTNQFIVWACLREPQTAPSNPLMISTNMIYYLFCMIYIIF